jgi:hypothetical protein
MHRVQTIYLHVDGVSDRDAEVIILSVETAAALARLRAEFLAAATFVSTVAALRIGTDGNAIAANPNSLVAIVMKGALGLLAQIFSSAVEDDDVAVVSNWAVCYRAVGSRALWTRAVLSRALWTRALWTRALWTRALWTSALWTSALWTSALWTSAVKSRAVHARAVHARTVGSSIGMHLTAKSVVIVFPWALCIGDNGGGGKNGEKELVHTDEGILERLVVAESGIDIE